VFLWVGEFSRTKPIPDSAATSLNEIRWAAGRCCAGIRIAAASVLAKNIRSRVILRPIPGLEDMAMIRVMAQACRIACVCTCLLLAADAISALKSSVSVKLDAQAKSAGLHLISTSGPTPLLRSLPRGLNKVRFHLCK